MEGLVVWGLLAEQALVLCACSERASELGMTTFAPGPTTCSVRASISTDIY